jgi:Tol biopolymer transport system component
MRRWTPSRFIAAGVHFSRFAHFSYSLSVACLSLILAGCLPADLRAPPPADTPTATATASPSPVVIPSPAPSMTLIPTPTPGPPLTDLGGLLRSLTTGWEPKGETAVLQQPGGLDGSILVAVPLDGSAPAGVQLLAFGQSAGWEVRPDGSAFAIALLTGPGSSRIASFDPRTGASRWVTADEPGVLQTTPVWSADGRSIYYAALRSAEDLGIFRIGADGRGRVRIRAPEQAGAQLQRLTPDGRGLVWARVQAGNSAEVLDLATGRNSSFDPTLAATSGGWREAEPRALVVAGNCCVESGRGTLYLWDDKAGTRRAIYGTELTPQEGVGSADWDPDGKRIVVSVYDTTISRDVAGPLVVMDENASGRTAIAGTEGATDVRWRSSGILYIKGTATAGAELWLVPSGGPPGMLFRGGYLGAWKVVAP